MRRSRKTLPIEKISTDTLVGIFEQYGSSAIRTAPRSARYKIAEYLRELSKVRHSRIFDDHTLHLLSKYVWRHIDLDKIVDTYRTTTDEFGVPFSRSYRDWGKTKSTLQEFAQENHPYFGWNEHFKKAKEELINQFKEASLMPQRYLKDRDIVDSLPKTDTNAGFTGFVSGQRKKGENMVNIKRRYDTFKSTSLRKQTFGIPIIPATRTQGSGVYTESGEVTGTCKHKTRMVSMVDLFQILAELEFAKPIQTFMSAKLSWYMGGKNDEYIMRRIMLTRSDQRYFTSLDYSSFDSSISDWLIRAAFDVIRAGFKEFTPEDERWFKIVRESFIHKEFLTPDGVVVSHRGVPSGSMFTQIVDSIVNYLVIRTYMLHKQIPDSDAFGRRSSTLFIMGDDNLVYCAYGYLNLKDLSSYVLKNFGLRINAEKSSSGGGEEFPEFLSRYWTDQGTYRHPAVLVGKMLYPERFRSYKSGNCKPEEVVLAYIYCYKAGMEELMDVGQFLSDYGYHPEIGTVSRLSGVVLPGYLKYLRDYEVRAGEEVA